MCRTARSPTRSPMLAALLVPLVLATIPSGAAAQEEPPLLDWRLGDGPAPIGEGLAAIELSDDYVYLDGEETRRLMELMENPVSDREVGTISPTSEERNWLLVFEWDPIGYVEADERGELDADGILESLREANESANEYRRERGWAPLELVGWKEPPFYDARTQNLTWATIGESDGHRSLNRNIRLLGRNGVMHVTLVTGPEAYDEAVIEADALLEDFRFRPGNRYAEFVPGKDRVAEVGLAALITGGAAAAAVKSGWLARFWKLIAAGAVAVLAAVRRFFGRVFGVGGQEEGTAT